MDWVCIVVGNFEDDNAKVCHLVGKPELRRSTWLDQYFFTTKK